VRTTIELSRLDDIWPSLGLSRLDVVKVDIEGHEDLFLQGANGTLARFRPVLLMEVNRWFFRRRAIDFDSAIPACLPPQYRFFRQSKPRFRLSVRHKILPMTEIARLAECEDLDDVFLVPAEKARGFTQASGGPVSMLSARSAGA
jgi:hypothetical protein